MQHQQQAGNTLQQTPASTGSPTDLTIQTDATGGECGRAARVLVTSARTVRSAAAKIRYLHVLVNSACGAPNGQIPKQFRRTRTLFRGSNEGRGQKQDAGNACRSRHTSSQPTACWKGMVALFPPEAPSKPAQIIEHMFPSNTPQSSKERAHQQGSQWQLHQGHSAPPLHSTRTNDPCTGVKQHTRWAPVPPPIHTHQPGTHQPAGNRQVCSEEIS